MLSCHRCCRPNLNLRPFIAHVVTLQADDNNRLIARQNPTQRLAAGNTAKSANTPLNKHDSRIKRCTLMTYRASAFLELLKCHEA